MRRSALAALIFAAAAFVPAWADGVSIPGVPNQAADVKYPGGGGGGPVPSYAAQTSPACYHGAFITSISIPGVGVDTGVIWVGASLSVGSGTYTAPQLGGVAATGTIGTCDSCAVWYWDNRGGAIPGTTATLTFTSSTGTDAVCASSGVAKNLTSITPTIFTPGGGGGDNQPFTMPATTVAAGGFGINFWVGVSAGTLPLVWTVATRDSGTEASQVANNDLIQGSAHLTASGTATVACGGTTCSGNAGWASFAWAWR
jgi:hypothetical protein